MDKMKLESPDLTAQNIDRIAALFPNCITEMLDEEHSTPEKKVYKRAVNFELLKQMLSPDVVDGDEAYEFTWAGKKAAIVEANKPIRKTLRPCVEESKDWDTTENLYIEGDNLEVLKLLQESYLGKVKMIYIDPPYNTGNDFIYADDFMRSQEEENEQMGMYDEDENRLFKNADTRGRFHSDWCSMLYSRLMLARNLLSEDGAVFISIGEQEVHNTINIGDEIFSYNNRVTIFNRVTKKSSNSGNNFSPCMDYIVIYAKNIDAISEYKVPMSEEIIQRYNKRDEFYEERGPFQEVGLFMSALKHGGSNYPIECPDGHKVFPPNGQPWRWNEKTFLSRKEEGRIVFKKTATSPLIDTQTMQRGEWNIYTKVYLKEREGTGMHPKNFSEEFQNTLAANEIAKLGIPFDFAKPTALVKFLIGLQCREGIVLDFFSGSATTAHAVMQLNAEDGGHRKFIMVQLPEKCDEASEAYKAGYKNICEIGKERIRRAGDKIKSESPMTTQDLDTGFRVLKLDDTNMKDVYYAPDDYDQGMLAGLESNIKDDRTDLDLLFGCLIDWGLPLSLPYQSEKIDGCTVHTYNDGDLIACFDANIPESVVKEIAKRRPLRAVFRDSGFASSPEKINVFEIFKLYMPEDANDISRRVRVI